MFPQHNASTANALIIFETPNSDVILFEKCCAI